MREYDINAKEGDTTVCEPILEYSRVSARRYRHPALFATPAAKPLPGDIRVVELFAGVGGFRIGFERASSRYKTVWSNQWEPSTKRQDASVIYCRRFGPEGHSNEDIATVPAEEIPDADLLCGGFPCQDYSVATTLANSRGIEGKKGVLWWQIHRILRDKGDKAPQCLVLENVDRLLASPAGQRGRDFAIILASLADLGYLVEWRVINAAEYGMPQRRRRTYIVAYREGSPLARKWASAATEPYQWITEGGVFAGGFPAKENTERRGRSEVEITGSLTDVSEKFNTTGKTSISPFRGAGMMAGRKVWSVDVTPQYSGPALTLGQLIVGDDAVPEEFFISGESLDKWKYLKGSKKEARVTREGFTYNYSEGGMIFPDPLDKPSRTIITGEGGAAPSRFKHIILTPSGRYRRLTPVELERLNMFPDNHTAGTSAQRRAFLMGNALVTGVIERIGLVLKDLL